MTKEFSPRKRTRNKHDYSIVKACFGDENNERKAYESMLLTTLFNGELTHLSFDCPKPLRQTFKTAVKANGSSVCHVLQTFMVTYLVANHYQKACFNDTYRHPITVKNLVIPTYVKERVRRVKRIAEQIEDFEVTVTCGHVDCTAEAIGSGVWRGRNTLNLCADHYSEAEGTYGDVWSGLRLWGAST